MTNFQWWADRAPAGEFLCMVCFETKPVAEAYVDDEGQAWDNCKDCQDPQPQNGS